MATLTNIAYFAATLGGEEKEDGSQVVGTELTIAGASADNIYSLAGGSGVEGAAVTCWSAATLPGDFDYMWLRTTDSDDIEIELAIAAADVQVIKLKQGIPFVLGRDDVRERAAYNSTPFNSPGSAAVVTRVAARNAAIVTTTVGTLRVAVFT